MAIGKFKIKFTYKGQPLTKSNQMKWWRGKMRIPAKIKQYEDSLALYAKTVMRKANKQPTKKFVAVKIDYYLKSKHVKDLSNLPKTTLDSFNEIVYKDDSQVHKLTITKNLDRTNPRIEVTVTEMQNKMWENG